VQFFAAGPCVSGEGRISHAFTTAMDLPATLLDLAGVEQPAEWQGRAVEPMRGRSMAEHWRGATDQVHDAATETGWELFGRRAIRRGAWKAVWVREPEGVGAWQLYDIDADPGETDDRAETRPELLEELVEAWDRYAAACGVVDGPVSLFETHPA